jgi:hypothetical protein
VTWVQWMMVVALVAAILLTAAGALAFWPEWPPIEPGVHRAKPDPANPPDPAPAREPTPRVAWPQAGEDEWVWSTDEAKRTRARHRAENIQEGTQRLPWHEVPIAPQPLYPPAPPVE